MLERLNDDIDVGFQSRGYTSQRGSGERARHTRGIVDGLQSLVFPDQNLDDE
jgi:hypothetical protein